MVVALASAHPSLRPSRVFETQNPAQHAGNSFAFAFFSPPSLASVGVPTTLGDDIGRLLVIPFHSFLVAFRLLLCQLARGGLARNAQPTPTPRHPPFSLSLHQSRVVPAPLLPSARSVTVQAQATGRGTRQRDMTALSPCDHIAALPTHPLPLRVQRNFWGAGLVLALGPEDEARCLRWKDFRRGRGLQQLSKTAW